ncbi:hypothetical protein HBI87_110000 [Parastagonospora nodorum]|nr:hypothetical protein HBI87_110000 [Parastagonospora nodorum]
MSLRPDAPAQYPRAPRPPPNPLLSYPWPSDVYYHPGPGIHHAPGFYPIVPGYDYTYFPPPPPYQQEFYDARWTSSQSEIVEGNQRLDERVEGRESAAGDGDGWDGAVTIVRWKQKGKKGGKGRRGDNATRREKAKEKKYGVGEDVVQKIERAASEKREEKVVMVETRERSQSMSERRVKLWSEL